MELMKLKNDLRNISCLQHLIFLHYILLVYITGTPYTQDVNRAYIRLPIDVLCLQGNNQFSINYLILVTVVTVKKYCKWVQSKIDLDFTSNLSIRASKVTQPINYFLWSPFSVSGVSLGITTCLDIAPFYNNYSIPCLWLSLWRQRGPG